MGADGAADASDDRRRHPFDARDRGWLVGKSCTCVARRPLRLSHRRQHRPTPRPSLTATTRWRPRPVSSARDRPGHLVRFGLARPARRRRSHLRIARRHVHSRRHTRFCDRQTGPPGGHRRGFRRADAGQHLQRHPQLGLRRRRLVRGARDLRRSRRPRAVRQCLPPAGARRDHRRGVQPSRPVGQLPSQLRPVSHRRCHLVGTVGEPGRSRLRRGPRVHPGFGAALARGVPCRWTAPRRRACPGRPHRAAPPRGNADAYRRFVTPGRQAAVLDRGERLERSQTHHLPHRRRIRPRRPVE